MIGTEGARLLQEKRVQGRPSGASAPRRTARGERVPGVEINVPKLYLPKKVKNMKDNQVGFKI
ncbi:hypothetical protein DOZ91_14320 [Peribacillus frigoritolerans]|nr:hypothetical protein DOZ91_14320 [Peribacillus frigoritolerans]KOR84835.1 hypothetical protein AM233_12550 [Bacillus sp. FJAT-22058]